MKNIKYVMFLFICMFMGIFYVNASCSDEKLDSLKKETKEIKITYKHLDEVEINGETYFNLFEVNAKNIPDNFYATYGLNEDKVDIDKGTFKIYLTNGKWTFKMYSNECEEQVDEINVFIPRFNVYYNDPLCEGIDGDDFALCGKYYEYTVSYESFKERVNYYRATHKIDSDDKEEESNQFEVIFNNVIKFVVKYKWYFIGGLIICLCVIISIIIASKRKKRGILE